MVGRSDVEFTGRSVSKVNRGNYPADYRVHIARQTGYVLAENGFVVVLDVANPWKCAVRLMTRTNGAGARQPGNSQSLVAGSPG